MNGALTAFDWFLLALITFSTLAAFFRGFVRVLFSLCGIVIGFVVASWYYLDLAPRLQLLPTPALRQIAAFLLIIVAITISSSVIAGLLRKALSAAGLGLFDRVLGGLFGFFRGVLLGVGLMTASAAFIPNWEPLRHSQLAPCFLSCAHAVSFIMPEHFQQKIVDGTTHLLQQSPALFQTHTPGQPRRD